MRIWDIHPSILCRQHLLGEHRELHGLWSILENKKKGYSNHPETLRWIGKLPALLKRHEMLVAEMGIRGYNHHTPLRSKTKGESIQNVFIHSVKVQKRILQVKGCPCII